MGDPRVQRFLHLLMSRGFVKEIPININGAQKKLFRFGPLGALLRRNIVKQWWEAVVLEQPSTFCVENPVLVPSEETVTPDSNHDGVQLLQGGSLTLRPSLSKDCSAAYLSALSLTDGHLPVSVASSGQCFPSGHQGADAGEAKLLQNGVTETHLLLQHYSPPVGVAQVFDYWLRSRLRWWRQFSCNPSKLSSSTTSCSRAPSGGDATNQPNTHTVISYAFPWGIQAVETIRNHGDAPIRQAELTSGVSHQGRFHQKSFLPCLIECQTSVEQCMSVFLTDAYREHQLKRSDAARLSKQVLLALQLHLQLSPYQVAMSATGSRSREVRHLADHVSTELRVAGFSVFNSPANSGSMEQQYIRNDEMGVPYTVEMSGQILDTGVLSVRSRDTRRKQEQHVSKLQSFLAQNTKAHDFS